MPPKFKLELPRFIAIRRRRRDIVKEERGNSNGTAVVGGPGHPTATLDSRSLPISTIDSASANTQSDLAVSASTSPIQSSSDSFGRQGLQAANLALSVVSPFAGAIPIVGSPIQAAINGLLEILNVVDQVRQNKEDIRELKLKLHDLNNRISTIPGAGPDFDISRDRLTQRLNETSNTLKALHERRIFQYSSVAKAINQCCRDIDSHLVQFSALNNMQLANYAQINDRRVNIIDTRVDRIDSRVDKIDRRTERTERDMHTIMGLLQHMSMGVVFIMDATGQRHSVPMYMARSFDQFKDAIRVHFRPETVRGKLLCRYMDIGGYDLCIDDGRQVLEITNDAEWTRVQSGTTVVMSIILSKPRVQQRDYLCPFCKVWNEVDEISGRSALDCLGCSRRFYITEGDYIDVGPDEDPDLIRNIHLKQQQQSHPGQTQETTLTSDMSLEDITEAINRLLQARAQAQAGGRIPAGITAWNQLQMSMNGMAALWKGYGELIRGLGDAREYLVGQSHAWSHGDSVFARVPV